MKKIRKLIVLTCVFITCLSLMGCMAKDTEVRKLKDVEFTIVKESEIPEELLKHIDAKKEKEFKFTFYNKDKMDYLYIVVGYGMQPTGGYSITIDDLYLTNNAIYIDTSLIGPSKDDVVTQAITYPYIVVKIEFIDKPVTFI